MFNRPWLAAVIMLALAAAHARAGELAPELLGRIASPDEVPVIIHLVDDAPIARADRRALLRELRQRTSRAHADIRTKLRGKTARELWSARALAVRLPGHSLPAIAALPAVERISLDAVVTLALPGEVAGGTPAWNLEAIGAQAGWAAGVTGSGAVVASLDSGVDPLHPAYAARFRGATGDWFDPRGQYAAPHDGVGHGTQTLGLAVGADAGDGPVGVAPEASWIAAKIFDDSGQAHVSDIHLALQWALDPDGNPDTPDTPHVVLAAWALQDAPGTCTREFSRDLAALKAADVAVVFAGGNSGPDRRSDLAPANDANSLAVGAVDASLRVPYFSARGPSACHGGVFPRVVAPGDSVRTTDRTLGGIFPRSYAWVSGTSFAAAHAAGALALLRSALPDAGVAHLESALMGAAADRGRAGPDPNFGYGLVDVPSAVARLAVSHLPAVQAGLIDVSVNPKWREFSFAAAWPEIPVVFTTPPTMHGKDPGVVQVSGPGPAAVSLRFGEWNYLEGAHAREDTAVLALPPGRWHMPDGSVWEVGRFTLADTLVWNRIPFTTGFGGMPHLFLTPQSNADTDTFTVRARRVSPSGFEVALLEEQARNDGHLPETIGYLAIHQPAETGVLPVGAQAIPYRLGRAEVNHRPTPVFDGLASLQLQEERSFDTEVQHVPEQIDLLDLGERIFAQQVSSRARDTAALRRN
ncbi:MAG: S8 family serine peptidase [Thiohalomonadaceae bacterium]